MAPVASLLSFVRPSPTRNSPEWETVSSPGLGAVLSAPKKPVPTQPAHTLANAPVTSAKRPPHIPPELFIIVAKFLTAPNDLLSLILTSRQLHALVTPTLHVLALRTYSIGWAAFKGHEPLVRLHLDKGVPADSRPNSYSKTPLQYAACFGHSSILDLLLSRGASIDALCASQYTALHFAILNGHPGAVKTLLYHGASVQIRNSEGLTPLLLAIRYAVGRSGETVLEMLLDAGSQVDAQESVIGWTALHWAVLKGRAQSVRLLLDRGASIRVLTTTRGTKETPVHWALKNGDEEMVVLLLEKGLREQMRGPEEVEVVR